MYLINPDGILFGANAQVNAVVMVASALAIGDGSLTSQMQTFDGSWGGIIVNQGTINADQGDYVALNANSVSNQGTIYTPKGTTALGAGSEVSVTFANN